MLKINAIKAVKQLQRALELPVNDFCTVRSVDAVIQFATATLTKHRNSSVIAMRTWKRELRWLGSGVQAILRHSVYAP